MGEPSNANIDNKIKCVWSVACQKLGLSGQTSSITTGVKSASEMISE
jgi:hypothetical protein